MHITSAVQTFQRFADYVQSISGANRLKYLDHLVSNNGCHTQTVVGDHLLRVFTFCNASTVRPFCRHDRFLPSFYHPLQQIINSGPNTHLTISVQHSISINACRVYKVVKVNRHTKASIGTFHLSDACVDLADSIPASTGW